MIRASLYSDLIKTLGDHERFDYSDFELSTNDSGRNTTLSIVYKIQPNYKIVFHIPTSESSDKDSTSSYYLFTGNVCPGPVSYYETFNFKGVGGLNTRVFNWLECIWEEISANPVIREIENQKKQIDEIYEKFETLGDEYFSKEEAEELKKRLDDLEQTLKGELKKNREDKDILNQEISKLHTDIDTLKTTITSFNKKGWLRNFTGKIFKWTTNSDNIKLVESGYKLVRQFLPENIKNSLPE